MHKKYGVWYNRTIQNLCRLQRHSYYGGSSMYRKINREQQTIEDFFLPFGGKLDAKNRWVKLAEITPWERIEEYYVQSMLQETGRGAISARVAFGAVSLRQSERLSDEDTVRYIQENPYVQYYLGLHEFHMEPLFDPSMMVHFRKRFLSMLLRGMRNWRRTSPGELTPIPTSGIAGTNKQASHNP